LAGAAKVPVQSAEPARTNAPPPAATNREAIPQVEVRGKVVCIPEEMHRQHGTDLPTKHDHVYGFRTGDGTVYTLLRTRLSEALFLDLRLHEKELVLKGCVLPKSHVLDAQTIRSVRNGAVCDLYYYCEICDIESVAPVPCACCQGPVELVEKPLPQQDRFRN
jgi:hypothetical protein